MIRPSPTATAPAKAPEKEQVFNRVATATSKDAVAGKKSPETTENRGMAEKLAEAGKSAATTVAQTAKSAALATVEGGANIALQKGKDSLQHWLSLQLGHTLQNICSFPFVGGTIAQMIAQTILPIYQELNPATKLDVASFKEILREGKVEQLGEEIYPVFTNYLSQHLTPDEQHKLQEGNASLMIKAFSKALYAEATESINTARQPGGIKTLALKISKYIPLINKLPESVQPWVGGAAGGYIGYRVMKFVWHVAKWAIGLFAGITGMKWLANKFGANAMMPSEPGMSQMGAGDEEGSEKKGVMSKLMEGVSKAAEIAAQAQGGGGHGGHGGGAPGIGQALAALAGAGKGGH